MPFEGDTPVEIAMKHLSQVPAPPSALRPELPPELDMVVMRALAKEPDDRYQNAEEMEADLERVARGAPVAAATEEGATRVMRIPAAVSSAAPTTIARPRSAAGIQSPEYYAPEPPRKRRSVWPWFVALLFVVVAAGGGWYAYSQLSTPSVPKVQSQNYVDLRSGACAARDRADRPRRRREEGHERDRRSRARLQAVAAGGNLVSKGGSVDDLGLDRQAEGRGAGREGQQQDEAVKTITDAKLNPDVHHVPGGTAGQVTAVSPQPGTAVTEGSTVRINVATGPAPVTVPKVSGESISQASDDLHSLGFKVNPVFVDSNVAATR